MTSTEYLALYRPEQCTEDGHAPGCPGRAGGDHELAEVDAARTYQPGDRVTVERAKSPAFGGKSGRVVAVVGVYAGGCTLSVALDGGYPALPFAPSEVDLAEVGDRLADDAGADWRLPA
jgi:hypothetical protein